MLQRKEDDMNSAFRFRIVDTGWPEGAHWAFPSHVSRNWLYYNTALVNPYSTEGHGSGTLSSFGKCGYHASSGAKNLSKSYR